MRERFYIYLLVSWSLILLFSCGKAERPAPDYDNRGTSLLLEACEDMRRSQSGAEVDKWRALMEFYPGETFPAVAYRLSQKRQLIKEANDLLGEVELHRLIDLVRESEKSGTACPELLAFSSYRDSLNQLRLFVSKMPWTDAVTLRENLRLLDLSSAVLSQSPAYLSFRGEQSRTLESLKVAESRAVAFKVLQRLDRALISGVDLGGSSSAFLDMCGDVPASYFSRCLRADSVDDLRLLQAESGGDSLSEFGFEVLCSYRWSGLGGGLRNEWLRLLSLRKPVSLCGCWLSVRHGLRDDAEAVFLEMLSSGSGVLPSQSIVREILSRRLLAAAHYQAWCWRSPCPGVTELLARLKQIGQRRLSVKDTSN